MHLLKKTALIAVILVLSLSLLTGAATKQVGISEFGDDGLERFLAAASDGVDYKMLVGIWLYEGWDISDPDPQTLSAVAEKLRVKAGRSERTQLKEYIASSSRRTKIQNQMARLKNIDSILKGKAFPLPGDSNYYYENTWHADRPFGALESEPRLHEGIDIICEKGTPVLSVGSGVIEKKGWLTLGGWRIGVRGDDGIYYYYAHMSAYANVKEGQRVKKGTVLGYVGSTGYGPEGTDDIMIPHLHFGMYVGTKDMYAVNAYPFLLEWEK